MSCVSSPKCLPECCHSAVFISQPYGAGLSVLLCRKSIMFTYGSSDSKMKISI